jgi:hypothetical protein
MINDVLKEVLKDTFNRDSKFYCMLPYAFVMEYRDSLGAIEFIPHPHYSSYYINKNNLPKLQKYFITVL